MIPPSPLLLGKGSMHTGNARNITHRAKGLTKAAQSSDASLPCIGRACNLTRAPLSLRLRECPPKRLFDMEKGLMHSIADPMPGSRGKLITIQDMGARGTVREPADQAKSLPEVFAGLLNAAPVWGERKFNVARQAWN